MMGLGKLKKLIRKILPPYSRRGIRQKIANAVNKCVEDRHKLLVDRTDGLLQLFDQRLYRLETDLRRLCEEKNRNGSGHQNFQTTPVKVSGHEAISASLAGERKPLAVFSPLPPSRTGIADFAAEQAPWLSRYFDVVQVIDDEAPDPEGLPNDLEVMRLSSYLGHQSRDHKTTRLYHLGNNSQHAFIFDQMLTRPGITVFHDLVMQHLISDLSLKRNDPGLYMEFMEYDYGISGRRAADQRKAGLFSEYEQFLLPLNGRLLDHSLGVIVHSRDSKCRVEERRPNLPVRYVPLHMAPLLEDKAQDSRRQARRRLGLKEDEFLLASTGFINEAKQIGFCLRALARIRTRMPSFSYWIVGQTGSRLDFSESIGKFGLEEIVHLTGYVELEVLHDYILASDVLLGLRYPLAGETSAVMIRALGLGRPVLVFDYGVYSEFPDDVIVKVPLGTQCTQSLEEAILFLVRDPASRERIGQNAAEYIRREHDIEKCAESYAEFIHQVVQSRAECI